MCQLVILILEYLLDDAFVAGALWAVVEITPRTLAYRQFDFFQGGSGILN